MAIEDHLKTWTTATGSTIAIDQMTDRHVANALRQLLSDPATLKALAALRLIAEIDRRRQDRRDAQLDDAWNEIMAQDLQWGRD